MPAGSAGCSGGGDTCSGGPPTGYYPPIASPEILPAPVPAPGPAPVPGGGSCALTDQCCNMDEAGCCLGGEQQQQCYTVWENKCRSGLWSGQVLGQVRKGQSRRVQVREESFVFNKV